MAKSTRAFTRLELLACLAAVALLTNIIGSSLAISTSRGDRIACFNNLRQIGAAYAQFGLEHGNLTAWQLPIAEGGNRDHPLKNNLFIQFLVLSNFIASPKVLMDPADDRRFTARPATSWGNHPQGGLLHPNFGNNSVSYFLGLDGNFGAPAMPLSGDRNLDHLGFSSCSSGVGPAATLFDRQRRIAPWTNAVHGLSGNILLFDGSVHEIDTPGFRTLIPFSDGADGVSGAVSVYHILLF